MLLPKTAANAKLWQAWSFGQLALPAAYEFLVSNDLQATLLGVYGDGGKHEVLEFMRWSSGEVIRLPYLSTVLARLILGDGMPKVSKFKIRTEFAGASFLHIGAPFFWHPNAEAAGYVNSWSHSTRDGPSIEVVLFQPTFYSKLVREFGGPQSFEVKATTVVFGREALRSVLPRAHPDIREWWRYFTISCQDV